MFVFYPCDVDFILFLIPCSIYLIPQALLGFPGGSVVKSLPANTGDAGSTPESRRSPGIGNGNLLQYSCLKNPIDRGAWQATVHGVTKELDMT